MEIKYLVFQPIIILSEIFHFTNYKLFTLHFISLMFYNLQSAPLNEGFIIPNNYPLQILN